MAVLAVLAAGMSACADFRRGPSDRVEPDAGGAPAAVSDAGAADAGGAPAALSFASAIAPVLRDGCGACHASNGQASGTALVLVGVAADDYAAAMRFVDVGDPPSSRLVTKARGAGHGGGAIWPAASMELQLVTNWISQGARP